MSKTKQKKEPAPITPAEAEILAAVVHAADTDDMELGLGFTENDLVVLHHGLTKLDAIAEGKLR